MQIECALLTERNVVYGVSCYVKMEVSTKTVYFFELNVEQLNIILFELVSYMKTGKTCSCIHLSPILCQF